MSLSQPIVSQSSSQELLVKRHRNLLQISTVGDQPLLREVHDYLLNELSFTRVEFVNPGRRMQMLEDAMVGMLDGSDPYAPFRPQSKILQTRVQLCFSQNGAIITTIGMLTKLYAALQKRGLVSRYVDLSPPRLRPNCYTLDVDSVRWKMPTIREDQWRCLERIANTDCGTIVAATGFGKSFLTQAVCHMYPLAKIHYVVPQRDVAAKVVATLTANFAGVGCFGGGKQRVGDRITVFTAGSIHHSDGDCDILLCDEVHELMTDRYVRQISDIWLDARKYALTATPNGRSDKNDSQIELCFGPQIYRMTYQDAVIRKLVVPIRVRWIEMDFEENPVAVPEGSPPMDSVSKMKFGIWRHKARNRKIAEDVRLHYPDPDTQILILCVTVDHAIHLWQQLPEFSLCFGDRDMDEIEPYIRAGMLPHNFQRVTSHVRESMRRRFESAELKRVIATDIWATGVDFRPLQVLYRVDARASANKDAQGPGRVSRLHDETGKAYGEVIDCYDAWDAGFRRKSESRRASYRSLGWESGRRRG
jgi:superfamily II DNA or RNA helicase